MSLIPRLDRCAVVRMRCTDGTRILVLFWPDPGRTLQETIDAHAHEKGRRVTHYVYGPEKEAFYAAFVRARAENAPGFNWS